MRNPKSVHGQFRRGRLTETGTVLVAHMDRGKVVEYDLEGRELWSAEAPGVWPVQALEATRALRWWTPANDLGPSNTIQILEPRAER